MSKLSMFVAASVSALCLGAVGVKAEKLVAEYTVVDGVDFLTEQNGAIFKIKNSIDPETKLLVGVSYEYMPKSDKTPITGTINQQNLPVSTATDCVIMGFSKKNVLLEYNTPDGLVYVSYKIQKNELKQHKKGIDGVFFAGVGELMLLDRSKIVSYTSVGGVESLQQYSMKFKIKKNKRITGFGDLTPLNPKTCLYWQDVSGEIGSQRVRVLKY